MKLLLITQDFPPVEGGMAQYYASLAAGFPRTQIIVSTTAAEGPGGTPPEEIIVHRESFSFQTAHHLMNGLRWSAHLDRLLNEEKPDFLLCGNIRPLGPICWQAHRRHGIPYALILHGNDLLSAHRRWSGWRGPLWNAVTGGAAFRIFNSRAIAALAAEKCGMGPSLSFVLYPEVDTTRFHPGSPGEKRSLKTEMGLPTDVPVILFVGRLVARKGLDRLIEALSSIHKESWFLAVVGYGDSAPYSHLAERLGISDRMKFFGAMSDPDLPRVYGAADLLAMPSRTIPGRGDIEGFGIVYLEAAAAGIPSVAGRSGGTQEAVLDGRTGLIVDGDSPGSIATALQRLLGDASLRCALGTVGRRRVEAEFGTGSMAARCLAILDHRVRPA